MHAADYNPAQQEVVSLLGAPRGDRPTFDAGLRDELRTLLEERLEPLVATITSDRFDDDVLYLSKFKLSQTLGCERKFMAELDEPFEWSIPTRPGHGHPQGHRAVGALAGRGIAAGTGRRGHGPPGERRQEHRRLPGALRRDRAGRAEGRGQRGHDPVPGVLPPAQTQMEAHDGQPDTGRAARRIDRAVGQTRPHARPTRRDGRRQGHHRLQDRKVLTPPPRRPALLRPAGGPAHPAAQAAGHLLPRPGPVPPRGGHSRPAAVGGRAGHRRRPPLRGAGHRHRDPGVAPGPSCRWCPVQPDCDEGTAYLEDSPEGGLEDW